MNQRMVVPAVRDVFDNCLAGVEAFGLAGRFVRFLNDCQSEKKTDDEQAII
jgi:hypothetical protein